jgi:hypothetical protein
MRRLQSRILDSLVKNARPCGGTLVATAVRWYHTDGRRRLQAALRSGISGNRGLNGAARDSDSLQVQ